MLSEHEMAHFGPLHTAHKADVLVSELGKVVEASNTRAIRLKIKLSLSLRPKIDNLRISPREAPKGLPLQIY
jgi:hypothetical protein